MKIKILMDRMEKVLNRLRRWERNERVGPLSLEIWPTNRCNLRCIMCGTWISRKRAEEKGIMYDPEEERKRELSREVWLKIVDDAIKLDVEEFLITGGGEPLLRKETTLSLMKMIKEHGKHGVLNTNGTLFTTKDISKTVEMRWDMIIFSVTGPNAETHDAITNVKGAFNKVKGVLLKFKEFKKKMRTDKPKVVFNSVLLNKNLDEISELIKFASRVNCEDITFIPLIIFDESIKKYALTQTQKSKLNRMIPKIEKLSKKLGVNTNITEIKQRKVKNTARMDELIKKEIKLKKGFAAVPCYEPFLHLLIMPDGTVSSCCMLADRGIKGDFPNESLKDIWFGDWFNKLREKFLRKELPKDCGTCVFSQYVRNSKIREALSIVHKD